jgi:hypothetical protein
VPAEIRNFCPPLPKVLLILAASRQPLTPMT